LARRDVVTVSFGEAVIPECLFRVMQFYGIQQRELTWNVVIWHLWLCCAAKFGGNGCLAKDDSLCLFAFMKCQPLLHRLLV